MKLLLKMCDNYYVADYKVELGEQTKMYHIKLSTGTILLYNNKQLEKARKAADKVLNENTTLINDIDWILDDGTIPDI